MIDRVSARAAVAALSVVAVVTGCGLPRQAHHVPDNLIPVFQAAAAAYGLLTPAQLAAQARVESKFDARAVSRAGARGMMQFLPSTWADYGIDGNRDGRADPMDPLDAIPSAARYESTLARLVEHLPGDRVTLILAAYNAGPDAVRAAGGVPDIEETRNYVSRVNTWAAAFADQL